ncbi:hypothetical protein EXQ30_14185 [Clostridium botulinum]|uniref:hypothetical protein n=1 Tax=Clostridium botulinum TaxID=1491 RepID=UPI001A916A81|nr:hypothetical protein [Clostridium botulinum]MBO0528464.1 hypothetical protein [Clostridium botulinum]MBO0533954.1 hypothetical protein [Clostridium botulinum]MBO0539844.1 hypothetical protein [Clostridium botulinum]MBO0543175.1 hypothetical protein [Clostridium botulinum]MBO0548516.1 hypothetical protein [Clostridium botulinum]
MENGYKKIFWGIFIIIFNVDLGIIKILPPFIGFIIILSGISSLYKESQIESFNKAKIFAIIISIIAIIGEIMRFFSIELSSFFIFNGVCIVFSKIIELLMFYKLFDSSIEYLNDNNQCDLACENIKKLRFYIIASVINIIFLNLTLISNIKILNIIVLVMLIILRTYLMVLISSFKNVVV